MAFHFLQINFINLAILFVITSSSSSSSSSSFPTAKPNCMDHCGNLTIPFPFGTTPDCYLSYNYFITCNQTFNPPKAFLQKTSVEITGISLSGQLTAWQLIAHDCYDRWGERIYYNDPNINLPTFLFVNNTANKFTIIGCDTYGFVSSERPYRDHQTRCTPPFLCAGREPPNRNYQTGCTAMCYSKSDVTQGSCAGLGCCQTSIPKHVGRMQLTLKSYQNYSEVWGFNNCSYAFVVEETAFTFSPENFTNLREVSTLPMVVDWAIGNETCEEAEMNSSSYACKSVNSTCFKPDNGYGYRCSCPDGYQGNPYLVDGCVDIDECQDPTLNDCVKHCKNTRGNYACHCPKGYHGDGRKGGRGCVGGESLVFRLVAGISLGVVVLLLSSCWLHLEFKRRRLIKMRQKFFLQNGGQLLQEKINKGETSANTAKVFSESELRKATNGFDSSMIVGRGGFGVVYKGILSNGTTVAIKKSKEIETNQNEQFINEVIVLSQINHRNVVRLLGCCLETRVPLLVYEFIDNGTLSEHVHNKMKAHSLSWEVRLRIATETAGVLAYLHSAASTPIIHRDVKSANILLDLNFTAKVSDFGSSRLVPLDQTQFHTVVQGTFGYLDPEYMMTHQLTEKSDVYSFGVVLVELLTGRKALCFDGAEEDQNSANFFCLTMKQDKLFQILDENVVRDQGNEDCIRKVAEVARSCLSVSGEHRPCMKDVAMELEGLRQGENKHSWLQVEGKIGNTEEEEDREYLLGEGHKDFTNSTSISIDETHTILTEYSGR